MSEPLITRKIVWLASYPKSGNTWFRAFLTALMNDGRVNINDMKSDGLFSLRETFDIHTDISSRDLYDDEVKLMLADVYRYIANKQDSLSFIKVHDFFGQDPLGQNLIPEDVTHSAIYFIRNPLDIAGSLANHMQLNIDDAIDLLNDSKAFLSYQGGNLNKNSQFRQCIADWGSHVESWTTKPSFPVCAVRYEDMLSDPFNTFNNALKFIGCEYTSAQIEKALAATKFDVLSNQEMEKGFKELADGNTKFFRKGTTENWKKELNEEQVNKILSANKRMMKLYKYTE